MDVQALLEQAREGIGARREYAEPFERDGVTVIPVSNVRGGGGGGGDQKGDGGGGFGMAARPAGAWVIKGGEVTWQPAVDPTRIALGAELVAAAVLLRRSRRARLRLPHRKPHRLQRLAARARLRRHGRRLPWTRRS